MRTLRQVSAAAALASLGVLGACGERGSANVDSATDASRATAVAPSNEGGSATAAGDTVPGAASPGTPAGGGATGVGRAGGGSAGSGAELTGPHAAQLAAMRAPSASPVVKGLYVNRFAAHSSRRMQWLLGVADSTEVNALVVDAKDEFGLNYRPSDPAHEKFLSKEHGIVRNMKALTDSLHAHGVLAIARIVVFKDPMAASLNPGWTIRRPDGSVWRDEKGHAWVNPYNREVWEYNLAVAEELVRLGFDEIQWDYIRFPEPYSRLPKQIFPGSNGVSKPDNIKNFLALAQERLHKAGVRSTADVFGLTTTVRGPLEIAQHWERLAPVTDVLLPMTYPSHYPRGSYGIARPNAEPYKIQKIAIDSARVRSQALGIKGKESVRPWIQAFDLGQPRYDASHVKEQIRGIKDAGYNGWVLWHPGSKYEPFVTAFAREG